MQIAIPLIPKLVIFFGCALIAIAQLKHEIQADRDKREEQE